MKKTLFSIFFVSLAAAVSCKKDDSAGSANFAQSFSKAEIKVEVTVNPADKTFGDYFSLQVKYWDFAVNNNPESTWEQPGTMKTAAVNAASPSFTLTTTSRPEAGKDYVADMIVNPVIADKLPETLVTDFKITVKGLIYDTAGNVIREVQIMEYSYSGEPDAERFRRSFNEPVAKGRYSLCYVEGLDGWFYNFGIDRIPNIPD